MAIVQALTFTGLAAAATTYSRSITVSAGSYLLICGGGYRSGGATDYYTCTAGGKPAIALTLRVGKTGTEDCRQVWFAGPFSAGSISCVISYFQSGGSTASTEYRNMQITEYASGLPCVATANGYNGIGTGADAVTTAAFTTPYNNCTIVTWVCNQSGSFTSYSVGTGYTMDNDGASGTYAYNEAVAHKAAATAGSYTATWQRNAAGSGDGVVLAVAMCDDSAFVAGLSAPSITFPLAINSGGRYMQDAGGTPVPLLGRVLWNVLARSPADQRIILNDTILKGFNAVFMQAPISLGFPQLANYNGDLPFTTKLAGGAYTDSTSNADLNTSNDPYWDYVEAFIAECERVKLTVYFFPLFFSYTGTDPWFRDLVANGSTKAGQYGTAIGTRFAPYANIIWVENGDYTIDTGTYPTAVTIHKAFIDARRAVSNQQSPQSTFHWAHPSTAMSIAAYTSYPTLNMVYNRDELAPAAACRAAWNAYAMPNTIIEQYYETNASITLESLRYLMYFAWCNSISGYSAGHESLMQLDTSCFLYLNSTGAQHQKVLNEFIKSIPWWRLTPSGLSSVPTLITASPGTIDTNNYVAAAAAVSKATLGVAYAPSGAETFSFDMSVFSATVTARWFNPTTGAYTAISTYPNTGSQSFTTPGDNGSGVDDYLLVLTSPGAIAPPRRMARMSSHFR